MVSAKVSAYAKLADSKLDVAVSSVKLTYYNWVLKVSTLGNNAREIIAKGYQAQLALAIAANEVIEEQNKQIEAFAQEFQSLDKQLSDLKTAGKDIESADFLVGKMKEWYGKFSGLDYPGNNWFQANPAVMPSGMKIIYNRWKDFTLDKKVVVRKKYNEHLAKLSEAKSRKESVTADLASLREKLTSAQNSYGDDKERIEREIEDRISQTNENILANYEKLSTVYEEIVSSKIDQAQSFFGKGKIGKRIEELEDEKRRVSKFLDELKASKKKDFTSRATSFWKLDDNIASINSSIKQKDNELKDAEVSIKETTKMVNSLKKELEK